MRIPLLSSLVFEQQFSPLFISKFSAQVKRTYSGHGTLEKPYPWAVPFQEFSAGETFATVTRVLSLFASASVNRARPQLGEFQKPRAAFRVYTSPAFTSIKILASFTQGSTGRVLHI
jgi:hypothetical protein